MELSWPDSPESHNIQILQHNCARSTQIMHVCMKFAKNRADIVILQESWVKDENITISHSSFICIKLNIQNAWITSRLIANNKTQREILLFNIYNEKSQNANDEQLYTIKQKLAKVKLNFEQKFIIAENFNAHHSWWNAKISNLIKTKALINWINLHKCNLINTSDIDTYHSYL